MRARLRSVFRVLFRRQEFESGAVEEMEFHIRQYAADLERSGMPSTEALRRARLEFGNVQSLKLDCRDVRGVRGLDDVIRDVVFAVRWLRRSPAFAVAAIVSVALGVGANAAVFSVLNALMLRPLPVDRPDEIVRVTPGGGRQTWTHPLWTELRARASTVAGMAAWSPREFDLSNDGPTSFVQGLWVSGEFFDVLGVRPAAGRLLSREDDVRGGGPAGPSAVISYRLWQQQFGGAADVLGRRISVDRIPFTVVGVTPPEFFGLVAGRAFDIAVPIGTQPLVIGRDRFNDRNWWWVSVIARLRAGQSVNDAQAAVRADQAVIREITRPPANAGPYLAPPFEVLSASYGTTPARQTYRRPVIVLMGIVGLVLLIACVNVANLTIAKSARRNHDLRVRVALGASSWRLIRQTVIESLLITSSGAVLGFLFARGTAGVLARQLSTSIDPMVLDLRVDWRLLAFMAAVTILTAVCIGLVPAIRASRVTATLTPAARAASAGPGQQRVASALMAVQVAVSLVMIVAAGLFVRTFTALTSRDPGFDADRILAVHVDILRSRRPARERLALLDEITTATRQIPGVAAAEFSGWVPASNNFWDTVIRNPRGATMDEDARRVYQSLVGPEWFAVYGIPIVAGRGFVPADVRPNADVAIVNETFAKRYFSGSTPLGETIQEVGSPDDPSWPLTVVGVVRDSVHLSLREVTPPMFYRPISPGPRQSLSVRSTDGTAAASLAPAIARTIAAIDPNISITVRPLTSEIGMSTTRERLLAWLAGVFGLIATLIASLGFYGVTAQAVAARRREIAIRLALGAGRASVARAVASRILLAMAAGCVAGILFSAWAGQFISALLYGVEAQEPITFVTAVLVLGAAGAVAAWVPTRRALAMDPVRVLNDVSSS
jgi:putative ABC transport system permease protein